MSCLSHRPLFVPNAREYSVFIITLLSFFPLAFSTTKNDAPILLLYQPLSTFIHAPTPQTYTLVPRPSESIVPILHLQPYPPTHSFQTHQTKPFSFARNPQLILPSSTFLILHKHSITFCFCSLLSCLSSFFNLLAYIFLLNLSSNFFTFSITLPFPFQHYALAYHPSCRPGIQ